jgi:hypothetical protein
MYTKVVGTTVYRIFSQKRVKNKPVVTLGEVLF